MKMMQCPECGVRNAPYQINKEKVKLSVFGIDFECVELSAHCTICGKAVYVPWVNDVNAVGRNYAFEVSKQKALNKNNANKQ